MVFKRYIHKHGKKLGPYYYENVRSRKGRVKTVYVGTNPSHHQKHRIRKPLFFLIIVLSLILILGGSLFLLQNKAYLINKVKPEPDFDVDQILLKILIKSGEFIDKQIRVMDTGSQQSDIIIDAAGLMDLIKINSPSFVIKPGQTKVVSLNFSSFLPEQNIEQQPGVYIGKLIVKSQKASKEIPIVVEIETKNVLFDMNLNPVAIERKVKQGADTTIEVRLFNLESIESVNVDVEYFVKDMNGNTIVTESETVVAKTQASFFKTISIPKNLKPGPYVFAALAKFGNSVGTSSYLFDVIGPEQEPSFVQFCKNNVLCLGLSLTTMLLLFALTAYLYFFIGAYLYEKLTGLPTLRSKEKIDEKINYAEEKKEREEAEEAERQAQEAEQQAEEKELEREKSEEKEKQEKKRLEEKEKQRQKELRVEKEIKAKRKEERKKRFLGLLHKIGFYKTPEEKKQIALQREKEKQEKNRKQEELKKEKELEKQKLIEQKKKEYDELRRRREIEEKEKEQLAKEKQGQLVKEKLQDLSRERSGRIQSILKILDSSKEALKDKNISKINELYAKAKHLYDELDTQEKESIYGKLEEFYRQRGAVISTLESQKKIMAGEKLRKEKEIDAKRKEERKKRFLGLLHEIGFYKTPEEKKQIALQKEKENRERLRRQKELKKQKEIEAQRLIEQKKKEEEERKKEKDESRRRREIEEKREEERRLAEQRKNQLEARRKEIEEEKKRQDALKRQEEAEKQEELKKQKELEIKKLAEQKNAEIEAKRKKIEDEKRKEYELRKQEELKKQKELEKQREFEAQRKGHIKAMKLEAIRQIKQKLGKNKETSDKLDSKLTQSENEKKQLSKILENADSKIKGVHNEIIDKSKNIKSLKLQKESLSEIYGRQGEELDERLKKNEEIRNSKIKELKAKLSEKRNACMVELEYELAKLSPDKRKGIEKWKKLELKAKLKIEEDGLWNEFKKHGNTLSDERKKLDDDYRISLEGMGKKQHELKNIITGLESKKQQALVEKDSIPNRLISKDKEIQKTRQKLNAIYRERRELSAQLAAHDSAYKKIFGFFGGLMSSYKEKVEKTINEKKAGKLKFEAEKNKLEEKIRIRREQEEKLRKRDEEKRKKEYEKKLKEEQKRKEREEKLRLKEEAKKEYKKENKKSKELEHFKNVLSEAKEAIENNDIQIARKLYIKSRGIYMGLDNEEKKEVYDELMEMYDHLKQPFSQTDLK